MTVVTDLPPRVQLTAPSGRKIHLPTGIFIDNTFSPAAEHGSITTPNPTTGKHLARVSAGTKLDVDRAVIAARKAFETTWGRNSTPGRRSAALLKWAELIENNIQELAELESLDNGKPVWAARDVDIVDSVACLRYYAGLADKIEGRTIEQVEGKKLAFTRSEAIGVCGQIIPWNYPIQMFAWKVAPALAAGNTVVIKPAEQTPLSALRLAELSIEAGFPPGVINVVNGLGSTVGESISSHMDIDKVAFTGSTVTGKRIMTSAASSNLKKVSLELGGKSAVVVFESADLKQAANWASMAILFNQGQDCCAGSRLLVQRSVHDELVAMMVENFEAHKMGDPSDVKTFQGPLVSKAQQEKVLGFIQSGLDQGAKRVTRERRVPEGLEDGYFVSPTIFTECEPGMTIVDEEIFGPVLTVQTFEDEAEAIFKANDTIYGLGAGVFSSDASQCMRVTQAIKAGTVWCNNYMALSNAVPFGGMKQSGFGRELGIEGIKEYTQTKAIHWNYGEQLSWPIDGESS
ncbi:aldehyde dehydrogenase [Violaceomyces palustris]|uniref:Aldehyde dehydrogenase n=1 Tax=Violaceomyces palustris TaxID=1673888 RepID=A0ACD0P5B1_9BASI|nr:aldehyde dehydrogenase [Violaceomyces palustris]